MARSTRGWRHLIARLLGDVNAVKRGTVGKRIGRGIAGRATGRGLGRLFKWEHEQGRNPQSVTGSNVQRKSERVFVWS